MHSFLFSNPLKSALTPVDHNSEGSAFLGAICMATQEMKSAEEMR